MSRGFLRSTSTVGGLTLLSRVSGLVRDMAYSHAFGAGTLMDAFLVAFKIPNFLRRLTAEGAFSPKNGAAFLMKIKSRLNFTRKSNTNGQ